MNTTTNQNAARDAGQNEAMAKVVKLLRLAKSDNPAEAALAATKAQEIIDRHKFNIDGILLDGAEPAESNEPIANFAHDPLDAEGSARWKGQLAVMVSRANQAKCFRHCGALCLIGRASDVQTVRYMYGWLVREVERLANRDCKGCGRNYWNNFRTGCVETISRRLKESAEKTVEVVRAEAAHANPMALMIVNKSIAAMERQTLAVESFAKQNLKLRKTYGGGGRYNHSARDAGRAAGNDVRFTRAAGALPRSVKKLS